LEYSQGTTAPIPTQQNDGARRSPRRERAFMKPIRYNRRQVALMVKIASCFSHSFAAQVGEAPARILEIAAGELVPPPAVLCRFGLEAKGRSYVWNPR